MLQRFNSLTARLILIAMLGTGLVIALGAVGWRAISRLIDINESIAEAEDQENRLLLIAVQAHNAIEQTDEEEAFFAQIRSLAADFNRVQEEFRDHYAQNASDTAIAQVLVTLNDTDRLWSVTESMLLDYMAAPDADARERLIDGIGQSITNTNVYANRTSEAFQAVAERERQNALFGAGLVGLVTLVVIGLIVSLIFDVLREMNSLTGVAHALSGGIYTLRAETRGLAEVVTVGETLNMMSDSIRQREAALREANETLEQRVHERTAELEKATAEAREASRAKDEFLSVMSHELRTPLNAILGYQGILELAGGLGGDNLDMVQRTGANARRLLGLINDVLDISRIEAGRMAIVPSNLAIRDFVLQIRSQMEVLASDKKLNFDVLIDNVMPSIIRIDEDAFTKIVVNLLGNAFKFTETGGVALSIKPSGSMLQIEVRDTGIGIPFHMQQIIFERFRQVDGSTTRTYGGSGLGLSIVQQLCALMGGTVIVNSVVGEGSTFTVTLPMEVVEPERAHV